MSFITLPIDLFISIIYLIGFPIYFIGSLLMICISSVIKFNTTPFKVMYHTWIDGMKCVMLNYRNPLSHKSIGIYAESMVAISLECVRYSIAYMISKHAKYHGIQSGYGWYAIVFSYADNSSKSGLASNMIVNFYGDISRYTYSHEFIHVDQLYRYGLIKYSIKHFTKHKLGSYGNDIDWAINQYTNSGSLNEVEIEAVLLGHNTPVKNEYDKFISDSHE